MYLGYKFEFYSENLRVATLKMEFFSSCVKIVLKVLFQNSVQKSGKFVLHCP
jgi:hypothetical protein